MQSNSPSANSQKKKIIAHVKPFRFENWLVLVLDPKWEELEGELVFECSIADGHIQLRSTKEVKLT